MSMFERICDKAGIAHRNGKITICMWPSVSEGTKEWVKYEIDQCLKEGIDLLEKYRTRLRGAK